MLRGGLEKRPRTARISDALGFCPPCTWKHIRNRWDGATSAPAASSVQPDRRAPSFAMPDFSAQVQQAAAELAVLHTAAGVLQTCDDGPVAPSSERVVHSSKLHLLSGIPEMRDQDLPREEVPGRKESQMRQCNVGKAVSAKPLTSGQTPGSWQREGGRSA